VKVVFVEFMRDRKNKFEEIYAYLYYNGHKGFVADNDIITDGIAFQYEIDKIKPKMCRTIKENREYVYSLMKADKKITIDNALHELFKKKYNYVYKTFEGEKITIKYGDFIAKRKRKPAGWSFMFTEDELKDLEKKYGKTNERRVEGSYNIYEVLNIKDKRFKEIKREQKNKKEQKSKKGD